MHERKMLKEAIEEVEGAERYIKCAMKYRTEKPEWAKHYIDMAGDELRHAENLHHMAGKNEGRTELEHAFLEELHEWYAERMAKAKHMLEAYHKG